MSTLGVVVARSIRGTHRIRSLGRKNTRHLSATRTIADPRAGSAIRIRSGGGRKRYISSTPASFKSALPEHDGDGSATSTPFLLADIGEGISEVELLAWHVSPGDRVSQFDQVCQVQSDKASVEITSRYDGVVDSLCGDVGDMMKVGEPLLYVATAAAGDAHGKPLASPAVASARPPLTDVGAADFSSHDTQAEVPASSAKTTETFVAREVSQLAAVESGGRAKVLTSPAVRKLAKENGVDLSSMQGSGPNGRILKADLLTKLVAPHERPNPGDRVGGVDETLQPKQEGTTVVPIRGLNRQMVKTMTESLQIPHMIYGDELNLDSLHAVRDSLRPLAAEAGVRLTFLPFFIKAASLAMSEYPVLNSTIDVERMELTHRSEHNVGIAMDTPRGLAVPVVRNCEGRSLLEIAVELGRLQSLVSSDLFHSHSSSSREANSEDS